MVAKQLLYFYFHSTSFLTFKYNIMRLHFFLTSICALFFITAVNAQSASNSKQFSRTIITRENDTVWVIVNPVKADKRAQFEKFINEVFWPGAKKLSAKEQQVFNQTRV